jgi:NitT/TauT family transport system substrate-binding protein
MDTLNRAAATTALIAPLAVPLLPGRASAQSLTTFRVATAPTMGAQTALYAQQSGIFRAHGLDVDVVAMSSGQAATAAVVGGSMQAAYVNVISLAEAHARGVPLVAFAPGGYYATAKPYGLLFVRKDSPIRTGRDLNGKTIGSGALKDINAICTLAWIDANGGDSKTVRALEVPNNTLMPALDEGRIDVATILPPYQAQALDSGKYRVIGKPYDGVAKSFEIAVWAGSSDYAAKNPDVVGRFAAAMRESSQIANATPAKAADVVAKFTGVDVTTVLRGPLPNDPPYIEPADLQPVIEAAVRYGAITKSFDAAEVLDPAVRRPKNAR